MEVATYTVPTDLPEPDSTLEWNSTTLVLVHAHGRDRVGLGYTYANTATATLIRDLLSEVVQGRDAMAPSTDLGRNGVADSQLGTPPGTIDGDLSRYRITTCDLTT